MPALLPLKIHHSLLVAALVLFGFVFVLPGHALADGVLPTVDSTSTTFNGFTTLISHGFWAVMFLMIVIAIICGMSAGIMAYRNQEVPVMLLATIITCIAIPAIVMIFAHFFGMDKSTAFF